MASKNEEQGEPTLMTARLPILSLRLIYCLVFLFTVCRLPPLKSKLLQSLPPPSEEKLIPSLDELLAHPPASFFGELPLAVDRVKIEFARLQLMKLEWIYFWYFVEVLLSGILLFLFFKQPRGLPFYYLSWIIFSEMISPFFLAWIYGPKAYSIANLVHVRFPHEAKQMVHIFFSFSQALRLGFKLLVAGYLFKTRKEPSSSQKLSSPSAT